MYVSKYIAFPFLRKSVSHMIVCTWSFEYLGLDLEEEKCEVSSWKYAFEIFNLLQAEQSFFSEEG